MTRCTRPDCGGTLMFDATRGQHVCLLCSRPAGHACDPLPYSPENPAYRRRAPRLIESPPGYRCLRAIAATTGLTKETLCMRLHARGIPSVRGANRTTLVAEADVAALVLGAKEWRERSKASIA